MHSDFKGLVAISLSMLLSREAVLTGVEDHFSSWMRVAMLVLSLGWLLYGVWHVFGADKER